MNIYMYIVVSLYQIVKLKVIVSINVKSVKLDIHFCSKMDKSIKLNALNSEKIKIVWSQVIITMNLFVNIVMISIHLIMMEYVKNFKMTSVVILI